MYFIHQSGPNGCGFACIKMLLATVHQDRRYLFLPEPGSGEPQSFRSLLSLAGKNNLELTAFRSEDKESFRENRSFPMLARLAREGGGGHMVLVLRKIGKSHVLLLDPEKGKVLQAIPDFLEEWDGNGMLVKGFVRTPCPYAEFSPIPRKDRIASAIFQVLSAAFLITGVYFVKEDAYFYWPMVFIALFAVTEILYRSHLFRMMQKMDDGFDLLISAASPERRKEFLATYEEYKKETLRLPMNFIFALLASVFLIFVFLLNGVENVLLLSAAVSMAVLESMVFRPHFRKKEQEAAEEERILEHETDPEEYLTQLGEVRERSYSLAKRTLFRKIVVLFVLFLTSLVTMMLAGVVSSTYILFYLSVTYAGYQYFTELFCYEENVERHDVTKARISNLLHMDNETDDK